MTVRSSVGLREVPEPVLALTTLSHIDYVDYFVAPTPHGLKLTPEQWARAMFGDVPDSAARFIWSGILGLRLDRRTSPDTVAGWRVAKRDHCWIRLSAGSQAATAELVVRSTGGEIGLATFVRYDRRLAPLVWRPTGVVHRRLIPAVLREAVSKARGQAEN